MAETALKSPIGNVIEVRITTLAFAPYQTIGQHELRLINAAVANIAAGKVVNEETAAELLQSGIRVVTRPAMEF